MDDTDRLTLDVAAWRGLTTFFATPDRLPGIIGRLLVGSPEEFEDAFSVLSEETFHQDTVSTAGVAALPYLPDVLARHPAGNSRILGLAANIAAWARGPASGVPPELEAAFEAGLRTLLGATIVRLAEERDERGADALAKAAIAFTGHCCRRLVSSGFDSDGTARTTLICPACGGRFLVAVFKEGLVPIRAGQPVRRPPPSPLMKPPDYTSASPTDPVWRPLVDRIELEIDRQPQMADEGSHLRLAMIVCGAGVTVRTKVEHVFSVLGAALWSASPGGYHRRYLRMWDAVACPTCDATFMAAHGWWGCVGR